MFQRLVLMLYGFYNRFKKKKDDIVNTILSLEKGLKSSATVSSALTARSNRSL